MASGAYPSLFEPVIIDDRYYIDGGVVNNFPVRAMKERGIDLVIGVDLGIWSERLFQIMKHFDKACAGVDYVFCSDVYLQEINQKFLGKDYLTDVIGFDLSEDNALRAEIYISLERIRDNAKKFSVTFDLELARVMIHGLLHMFGFDDHTAEDKNRMQEEESRWLKEFKLL
ncbi:unnamed protein product, partial [Cyprideis torosa]